MTRINCVPPAELVTPHLVAEYRELPRVFGLAQAAYLRGEQPADPRNPTSYTLGRGHVRFFYARLGYCRRRFAQLVQEGQARGFKFQHTHPPACNLPEQWLGDWNPDQASLNLNRARIRERLQIPA